MKRDRVFCRTLSFGGVLQDHQPVFGDVRTISAITAFASVVLPDPVPPDTTDIQSRISRIADQLRCLGGHHGTTQVVL